MGAQLGLSSKLVEVSSRHQRKGKFILCWETWNKMQGSTNATRRLRFDSQPILADTRISSKISAVQSLRPELLISEPPLCSRSGSCVENVLRVQAQPSALSAWSVRLSLP